MKLILILALSFSLSYCNSQNTLQYNNNKNAPKATLQDVSWIAGHWIGEAFGGITEEIWSPPLGNSMMFSFKLVNNGKVVFYELGAITETNGTLLLQLKHFGPDFKGWEEKDDSEVFKLVKIESNRAYFNNFTFEKISDNEINLYVVISEEGATEEVKFNYKRKL